MASAGLVDMFTKRPTHARNRSQAIVRYGDLLALGYHENWSGSRRLLPRREVARNPDCACRSTQAAFIAAQVMQSVARVKERVLGVPATATVNVTVSRAID